MEREKIGQKVIKIRFLVNQAIFSIIFSWLLLGEGISESAAMLREMGLKSGMIPEATQQMSKVKVFLLL